VNEIVANEFNSAKVSSGSAHSKRKELLITNVPPDYVKINSGLGEAAADEIVVLPFCLKVK
jgi:hypothetical protein